MKELLCGLLLPSVVWAGYAQSTNDANPDRHDSGSAVRAVRGVPDDDALQRDAWSERLAVADLDEREAEFDELVSAARRARDGARTLKEWSRGEGEFAWTCRLALRELERAGSGAGGVFAHPFAPDDWAQLEDLTDGLSFFFDGAEPFTFGFGGQGVHGGLDDLFSSHTERGESVSLSVTPDGVKCTIRSTEDGEEQTEEYEAESLEALLEAHPELRERGVGGASFSLEPFQFEWGAPRRDVLGVYVQEVEDGPGLFLEGIAPGTIAEQMGLEAGQTLLELNGRSLSETDDVSAVLRERESDAALEALILDADGERRTLRWEPQQPRKLPFAPRKVRQL